MSSEIERMRVFLRVAELSSFTAAASSLAMPKASVSTAVQQLEAWLGTRLFHRTTRRVTLTQDGQLLFERAQELVHGLDDVSTLFRGEGEALRGRIRMDMPVGAARDVIIPALPELLATHPELELELSSTDRFVDLVREGFDCVLRVGSRGDASAIVRTIGHYRVISCASREYLARHGTPGSPAELAGHHLVHYASSFGSPPDGFEYVEPDTGRVESIPLPGAITVNNSAAYSAACLAGLGIIQVPDVGVQPWLERGELVEILPGYRPAPLPVSLLYPDRRHLPRRVRVVMDWMAERLRPHLQ
jgi:DNA-binding transcriptional LysR family regulator